jgi:hypothetical protein
MMRCETQQNIPDKVFNLLHSDGSQKSILVYAEGFSINLAFQLKAYYVPEIVLLQIIFSVPY